MQHFEKACSVIAEIGVVVYLVGVFTFVLALLLSVVRAAFASTAIFLCKNLIFSGLMLYAVPVLLLSVAGKHQKTQTRKNERV